MTNNEELLKKEVPVHLSLIALLAIHGNLCLALRHPENNGASARIAAQVMHSIGIRLVEEGVLSEEELQGAYTEPK